VGTQVCPLAASPWFSTRHSCQQTNPPRFAAVVSAWLLLGALLLGALLLGALLLGALLLGVVFVGKVYRRLPHSKVALSSLEMAYFACSDSPSAYVGCCSSTLTTLLWYLQLRALYIHKVGRRVLRTRARQWHRCGGVFAAGYTSRPGMRSRFYAQGRGPLSH
jgi:hypothetical protein